MARSRPAHKAPTWVIVSCALAISLGTYIGGWRVIRTLGKGLVEIDSRQGMAAESSSASVILLSSHFGYSLSTTHVATGSILGTGLGRKGAEVRWNVAGRMAIAWVVTLPSAALVGAGSEALARGAGTFGVIVVAAVMVVILGGLFLASRKTQGERPQRQRRVGRQARRDTRPPRCRAGGGAGMSWINWAALGKILGVGLLAGAGLPALFAIGLRFISPRGEDEIVLSGDTAR